MITTALRIVQMSDTHLYATPDKTLLGVNTQDSFQAVLDALKADDLKPDFLLLTGDLSQDGSVVSYRRLVDQLSELRIPIYCVPGNHDLSQGMATSYPYGMLSMDKQIVKEHWQFILLDSHIDGKVPGQLEADQLAFMEQCLTTYPSHHAIIVFHHQPISVNCAWLDKLGVLNAEVFWQVVAKYPQVHTVLFGHVHQQHEGKKDRVAYYSTPSTCIQFKGNSDQFALEKLPPGYRIIDLYANGELHTCVRRVENYVGVFDEKAKGY